MRHRHTVIPSRCRHLALASAVLAALGAAAFSSPAPQIEAPVPLRGPADSEGLLAVVTDPNAPRPARDAAADLLLPTATRRSVVVALSSLLTAGSPAPAGQDVLIDALARTAAPPSGLLRPLVALAAAAPPEDLPRLLAALGSFRDRTAARTLVSHIGSADPAVHAAALAALIRLTGRSDLAGDRAAWDAWLEQASRLSESAWRDQVATGLAARADRLDAERSALLTRLVDTSRRLYLAAQQAERGPMLAGFLLDDRDELRALGFEIVARELSAGARSFDAAIGDAAIRLLEHPDSLTRARAALLLNQLAPQGAGPALIAALAREQRADVAAALLAAAARSPAADLVEPALRWLEAGPPARSPAMDVLLALRRAGLLEDPAHHARILAALRATEPQRLKLSACRLLVSLGNDGDRAIVAGLLSHEAAAVRLGAAEALSERADMVDTLLAAAANDPGLFEPAVRAVVAHRPDAASYRALAAMRAPTPEAHRDGLLAIAPKLSDADLIAIARDIRPDAEFRESLLGHLFRPAPDGGPAAPRPAAAEGLVLLAETRLALGRPDAALIALDAIPDGAPADPARIASLRTTALVWTNRLDEAQQFETPAACWLDGLEYCIAEPHARAVVDAIQYRFGDRLSSEEIGRLDALTARIAEIERLEQGAADAAGPTPETGPG